MRSIFGWAIVCALAACGGTDDGDGAGGSGGTGGSGGGAARCEPATELPCEDTMIQELSLQSTVAPGLIETERVGEEFRSLVDATAGGAFASPPHAFVYARFTDGGLEKVEIDDEGALASAAWDIAFRRFYVRINSGDSGPSCVVAAATGASFENAAVPAEATAFGADDFYTDSCELVPDGSGLDSSPRTQLAPYYDYASCVAMTGEVFVLQLADGRHVKLQITGYYAPQAKQDHCDTTGEMPPQPSGAANIGVRWAFLE